MSIPTKQEIDKSFEKVQQNQIWEVVTDDFLVKPSSLGHDKKIHPRRLELVKGERIEIRYPSPWHFRTIDNQYFAAEAEEIVAHCKPYGVIWGDVSFKNTAHLNDILRLGLYEPKQ